MSVVDAEPSEDAIVATDKSAYPVADVIGASTTEHMVALLSPYRDKAGVPDQSGDAMVSTVADLSLTEVPGRLPLDAALINEVMKKYVFTDDEAID
eukprot:IDg7149t1